MTTKAEVIQFLSNLPIEELRDLICDLEDQWGFKADEPKPITKTINEMAGWASGNFYVLLLGYGQHKINVIKEVKDIAKLGLKEAKDMVELTDEGRYPFVVEGVSKEKAEIIAERLRNAGATVKVDEAYNVSVIK